MGVWVWWVGGAVVWLAAAAVGALLLGRLVAANKARSPADPSQPPSARGGTRR